VKEKGKKKKVNNKNKIKIKWSNIILLIVFIACFIGLIVSFINILKWNNENKSTNEEITEINNKTDVVEIPDNTETEVIEQADIPKENIYWKYVGYSLIDVNLNELKATNSDTVGWLQVSGTNINYPFVQTTDNVYYLTHSFYKKINSAGWVFLDYRNKLGNNDANTILYAHGRVDKTMFGSLKNILTSGWLDNADNYVVKLSTEYENTLWQVFSVYHIPTTSDYLQINFSNSTKYQEFLNTLINRSAYNFNTTVTSTDRILTLSTCYNTDERVVLHAKLIKREIKNA